MKKSFSLRATLLAAFLALGAGTLPSRAADVGVLKENYFISLPEYVDWPGTAFGSVFSPFVFGVLGDGVFAKALSDREKGLWLNGHPVSVLLFQTFDPK